MPDRRRAPKRLLEAGFYIRTAQAETTTGARLTRRALLSGVAGAAVTGLACSRLVGGSRPRARPLDEFVDYDALGLAELIRRREVEPAELVEVVIRRIEALDGKINAVATRAFDRALAAVERVDPSTPFAGVPTLVKDMIDVGGLPRTDGSRLLLDNVPTESVAYIHGLERSGLVIMGTTNVPELAVSVITDNEVFGPTRNPWNLDYSPMGSSGGTAAAVAAGYVPIAHGTDGGGSNRLPASACGLLGMKPSRGRMLSGEKGGGHDRFKTNQALSRTVRDSATLFAATEDPAGATFSPIGWVGGGSTRRVRIAYMREGVRGYLIDPEVQRLQDDVATLCRDLGHDVEEIAPLISGPEYFAHYNDGYLPRFRSLMDRAQAATDLPVRESGLLSPFAISIAEYARDIPAERTRAGLAWLDRLHERFVRVHERFDVVLSAVSPIEAQRMGAITPRSNFREKQDLLQRALCLTAPANVIGAPAMSVPLSRSAVTGLPVGSMFQAAVGGDRVLYELAFELEAARPWRDAWARWSTKRVGGRPV